MQRSGKLYISAAGRNGRWRRREKALAFELRWYIQQGGQQADTGQRRLRVLQRKRVRKPRASERACSDFQQIPERKA